jgi:CPA2 family monovalent cation:H+ antiporter-2
VLLVALAAAWASQTAGFSMALGAFLAGMMLAETEYSHQVESVIRPFRDILLGLFFISVGMLLDFHALWSEFWLIFALAFG